MVPQMWLQMNYDGQCDRLNRFSTTAVLVSCSLFLIFAPDKPGLVFVFYLIQDLMQIEKQLARDCLKDVDLLLSHSVQ